MRIVLIAAIIPLIAVGGCRNSTSNNSSGKAAPANTSAPATTDSATNLAIFRRGALEECERQVRPQLPPGLDATTICGCAIDSAWSGEEGRAAARTPQGQQALATAIATCVQQTPGVTAPVAQPPAEAPADEPPDAETSEEG